METLKKTIDRMKVGPQTTFRGLTLFPLMGGGVTGPPDYLTLDEALKARVVTITELEGGASVPQLHLINEGDRPVLIMDGEELVGAKQNRTLNVTVLAPPRGKIVIPVSCVEAGRWNRVSRSFAASPQAMYAEGRMRRTAQVAHSLALSGQAHADQGEVWQDIDRKMHRMGVRSRSREMSAMYEDRSASLEGFVGAFEAQPDQEGALFAIGGRLVGLDLFDHPETFRRILPKLVRSYALDAVELGGRESTPPSYETAEAFLGELREVRTERFETPGLGEDLHFRAPGLTGAALVVEGRVVHLSAFRSEGESDSNGGGGNGRLRRASGRRQARHGRGA